MPRKTEIEDAQVSLLNESSSRRKSLASAYVSSISERSPSLPLLEKARIEVYLPELDRPEYADLLAAFDREFSHAFGGCSLIRNIEGALPVSHRHHHARSRQSDLCGGSDPGDGLFHASFPSISVANLNSFPTARMDAELLQHADRLIRHARRNGVDLLLNRLRQLGSTAFDGPSVPDPQHLQPCRVAR